MTGLPQPAETAAFADDAMALFVRAFPDHGLKIVVPPPSPGGMTRTASVSIWRRGEARALSCSGATPVAALLLAIQNEIEIRRDRETRAACKFCDGVGWYVSIEGTSEICRHTAALQQADINCSI
jgi:hypothetical protein